MLSSRAIFTAIGPAIRSQRRKLLSAAFALEKEWAARHGELTKLGLGGDYEWISAVQKKFIGGGVASAVDVDAAVCVAEQRDQVDDVLELVYKLRHSENAADLPSSTEYALIRLLLKYEPEIIFKLAQDPINYGIFFDEHSACLVIDHFIKANNIQGAARLSAWVMQQEQTGSELLNMLALYSCVKWAELPAAEQIMPKEEVEEEEVNEDDMKSFKFPFLKNHYFDGHFDLEEPAQLAGKTLLWLARETKTLDSSLRESIRFLGAVLLNKLGLAATIASSSINGDIAELVRIRLTPTEEGAEPTPEAKKIIDSLAKCKKAEKSTSETLLAEFEKIQESEESKLMESQKKLFEQWNTHRSLLVRNQAERVLLKIRSEEIQKELTEIDHKQEMFFFFENRLKWEKKASEHEKIAEEAVKATA